MGFMGLVTSRVKGLHVSGFRAWVWGCGLSGLLGLASQV